MPSCKDIDAQIVDWLYDELDASSKASFREHIDSCNTCSASLASLTQLRELMRAFPEHDPPVAVSNILLHEASKNVPTTYVRTADGERREQGIWGWLVGLFQPIVAHPAMAAVATVMLVVTIGGVMYLREGPATNEPVAPSATSAESEPFSTTAAAPRTAAKSDRAAPLPSGAERQSTRERELSLEGRKQFDEYSADLLEPAQQAEIARLQPSKDAPTSAKVATKTAGKRARGDQWSKSNLDPNADGTLALGSTTTNAVTGADQQFEEAEVAEWDNRAAARVSQVVADKSKSNDKRPADELPPTADDDVVDESAVVSNTAVRTDLGLSGRGASADDGDMSVGSTAGQLVTPMNQPPPPPPPATSDAPTLAKREVAKGPTRSKKKAKPRRATEAKRSASKPIATPQGRSSTSGADRAKDIQVSAWSEAKHGQLLQALNSKRCTDAAVIANDLMERDRKYYSRHVRGASALSPCRKLVAAETTRRAKRKAKQAKKSSAKRSDTAAPAPTEKAAAESAE